jgi:hypothetical protein
MQKHFTIAERLLQHAKRDGDCLLWTGTKNRRTGYGYMKVARRHVDTHRLSYETFVGLIPEGLCVCHQCDVRLCMEPAHLFLGTRLDNQRDMSRKGRAAVGSRNGMSTHPENRGRKLTAVQVLAIRTAATSGVRQIALAQQYGVDRHTIYHIVRRKTWAHV